MIKNENKKWFTDRVKINENGCWILPQKPNSTSGYVRVRIPGSKDRKAYQAHRLSYEAFIKKIPKGLVIDHLCRVRECCNPDHLEPVTQHINILRGVGASALNANKTHCKRGHELNKENMIFSSKGLRVCKTCKLEKQRKERNQKPRTDVKGIELNGKEYSISELSEKYGIKHHTLYSRIYVYGWSVEQSVETKPSYNTQKYKKL